MNESDHVHYCDECNHWYLCKQVEFRCELNSNSVTNHKKHITSMAEYIKPLFWKD